MELPEPFRTAIQENRPGDVADEPAGTPLALLARGIVRARVGREKEARADFLSAQHPGREKEASPGNREVHPEHREIPPREVQLRSRIEVARLDLRGEVSPEKIVAIVEKIVEEADEEADADSLLKAGALHLLGTAQGKARHTSEALATLLKARTLFREAQDRSALAQVLDSLGQLYQSLGQVELATVFYAQSIVQKMLLHDRYGAAITLGNLGRLHLQASRYDEAISCFEQDLEIAIDLRDLRGQARMHEDLGRTFAEMGQLERAIDSLSQCITLAKVNGFTDLEFLARIDLSLAHAKAMSIDASKAEVDRAGALLRDDGDPFHRALFTLTEAKILRAEDDSGCIEVFSNAARQFEQRHTAELEVRTLVDLAEAAVTLSAPNGHTVATRALTKALDRASSLRNARLIRSVREAIQQLDITPGGVLEERGRHPKDHSRPSSEFGSPPLGPHWGAYTLLRLLGEGAYGRMYEAFDPIHDRKVAFKELKLGDFYDRERVHQILKSAKNEFELAQRIQHPGIATVYAIGMDEGLAYVAQELIEGYSFREVVKQTTPPESSLVVAKLAQISSSLAALHEMNILHRDLKPENILVRSRDQSCVLVDFGIAYLPDSPDTIAKNVTVGTPPYMAPEVWHESPAAQSSDIYSLGIVLFEWLTDDPSSALPQSTGSPPRRLAELRPDLHPALESIVNSMISESPGDRPTASHIENFCRRVYPYLAQPRPFDERETDLR